MTNISVCIGTSCHLKGSYNIIQTFQQLIEENGLHDRIGLRGSFCMRGCDQAGVRVSLDEESYNIAPEEAHAFFKEKVIDRVETQ